MLGDSIGNGIQAKGDGLVNDFPGKVLSKVELQWRSVFDSPDEWWDCREAKKQGMVNPKSPGLQQDGRKCTLGGPKAQVGPGKAYRGWLYVEAV